MQKINLPSNTIIIIPNEVESKKERAGGYHHQEGEVCLKSDTPLEVEEFKKYAFPGFLTKLTKILDDSEPLHFIDHPDRSNEIEPRYYPIEELQRKEEVAWLIKCLRAVESSKTQDLIKRILDKVN